MKSWICALAGLLGSLSSLPAETSAKLQVVALHPLMADLARQVGQDRVEVHDLVGEGSNPHRFEPRPEDMARMRDASIVLAAGMGLEPYLGRLRDTLGADKILEVGATLPALGICGHGGCTDHHHESGNRDPHWWHHIDHMARASWVVAEAFGQLDSEHAAAYALQAANYRGKLAELKRWARLELAKVPESHRKLVTTHQAFAYFANEFDFEVIAIAGLNAEQETSPQDLAATIERVRKAGIEVVFPEAYASTRMLEAVGRSAGTRLGPALIADGNGKGEAAGFEGMIRHNVAAIVGAIASKEAEHRTPNAEHRTSN
ncbi:MAG TPA: metal ABC transporter substrate-binding protein [Luteolibacter sp.]|nr:metal ABC transporter substrate-binding protein [Luteolibacter sp.]